MKHSPRRNRFRVLAIGLLVLAGLALFFRSRPTPTKLHPVADTSQAPTTPLPTNPIAKADLDAPTVVPAATPAAVAAPTLKHRPLFSYVAAPADAAELEARLPAPTQDMRYVKLDRALIGGKGSPFWQAPGAGKFSLPLPDGSVATVVIAQSEMVGAGRFTSTGVIEGHESSSRAVFAYNNGILHAVIEDVEKGSFTLRYGNGDVAQFFAVDPAQLGSCAGGVSTSLDAGALAIKAQALAAHHAAAATASASLSDASETSGDPTTPPVAAAIVPTNAEVHLMMIYTQDVGSAVGSAAAVQSAFDLAVATVNADFARSQISARLKLVKVQQVTYDETISAADKVQQDALTAAATGKISGVYALRDQYGADLVNLVVARANTIGGNTSQQVAGIGYLMDTPSIVSTDEFEYNSSFGYTVVRYAFINSQHVLSHELGHNFGAQHDRDNAKSPTTGALIPGAYPYSYGFRVTGKNGLSYHDIMSYDPPTLLPYFSNPDLIPTEAGVGVPFGIAGGLAGESNTALTIEKDAPEVASFRLQQITTPNAGTLVNVATLAYAGTGEQQLIGGFVINGPQPKTVMVRAVGPTLGPLGVTGFLANPSLILYRVSSTGSTEVARNDDWNVPLNGGATGATLSATATQVGATPLLANSLDAAVLTTLPATTGPVSYTVNITGVNNTTGTALVEAYEVGGNTSRILNLATRGYMDVNKPMTAGFVVVGTPGTTKRILIRVTGPSLAAYGLVGAADPAFTLYNAAGQALIANDDFSTDSVFGDTTLEAAIIASGYAPKNRQEPCVIMDLAPGAYTVIAAPFSTSTQAPAPGLAIVEVYEIN